MNLKKFFHFICTKQRLLISIPSFLMKYLISALLWKIYCTLQFVCLLKLLKQCCFVTFPLYFLGYFWNKVLNYGIFKVRDLKCVMIFDMWCYRVEKWSNYLTAQKMKFSIKDFFSKCYQVRSFLRFGHIYWRNP